MDSRGHPAVLMSMVQGSLQGFNLSKAIVTRDYVTLATLKLGHKNKKYSHTTHVDDHGRRGGFFISSLPWRLRDSTVFIVIEYVHGWTLTECLDRNPVLPERQIKRICREILEAVTYIHDSGFHHRDIKCCNVRINAEGHL